MASFEDQLSRYRVLMQMARCFGRAMDLPTLIDQILDQSRDVMRAEACTLFLPDIRTGELILHSTDPKVASLPAPLRLPPGKGFAGAVFLTREPVNIKDAPSDPRYFQHIAQRVGFTTRAMLTIPLLDGANCVGVLQALNPVGRDCFDAQDEEIFEGFGGLIANALVRIEAARREIDLAKSRQELAVAREIQESFLPQARQEFAFCKARMEYFPASAVGGDFCSVHALGQHRLLLGLGDVTGKGIPAALTMARATAMIKALLPQLQDDLGAWVSLLNTQLAEDLQSGRFIGMTFLLADALTETIQVCAAGQFAPLRFNENGWQNFAAPNHLPLGIVTDITYTANTAALKPGERWLLFSDGVPDARNLVGEDFTLERILSVLSSSDEHAPGLDTFVAKWKEFANAEQQHDDASLLLLDWRGPRPAPTLELSCCPETLCREREFVEGWAAFAGFDDTTRGQIVLACDEATTNIFRHAYGGRPGPITLHADVSATDLIIRISDQAKQSDPKQFHGRELSDLRPGGLGTVIMKKVFDDVQYEAHEGGTTLRLSKKLPA